MIITELVVRLKKVQTRLLNIRQEKTVYGREWSHVHIIEYLEPIYQEIDDIIFQAVELDARKSLKTLDKKPKL